ncbi:hypothetical protein ANO11243_059560 [Dothideomycetidae sp. 11243]|nr:hypothetical protein ANO11243_059560 [fungal sp. No.11243]
MEELLAWLQSHGGYLHKSTRLARDGQKGCHLQAQEDLPSGTLIVHVPHTLVLSCLNAMVDDSLPALKSNADSFSVEALGVFYLMAQWLRRDTSFWKPYLEILNSPETGFNTPFWFSENDLVWLQGTDLLTSFEMRRDKWQTYWRDGTAILYADGMDVSQYTWTPKTFTRDLCKWATTVYTSRSLSSRAVRPQESKYWTAYNKVPEERKDFPVLIPGMDCLNHHHDAHVDWTFEPGRFVLTLGGDVTAGNEVLNNYGPKSNSELLMGYGFCVEDNPFDCVFQALKPPPADLQPVLRQLREWRAEGGSTVWDSIPIILIELFYYMVRHERGLAVDAINGDIKSFLLSGSGRRYLPRIAFLLFSSLLPKITKITESDPDVPAEPSNEKQRCAKIYRDGQRRILLSLRKGFLRFQQSLRIESSDSLLPTRPYIMTLEEAVHVLSTDSPASHKDFIHGITAGFGLTDLAETRGTPIEQQIWVLYICFALIAVSSSSSQQPKDSLLNRQVVSLLDEYSNGELQLPAEDEDADDPEGQAFLAVVAKAAAASGEENSIWRSRLWSCSFVLDWGLRIARSQGMQMRVDE